MLEAILYGLVIILAMGAGAGIFWAGLWVGNHKQITGIVPSMPKPKLVGDDVEKRSPPPEENEDKFAPVPFLGRQPSPKVQR